MHTIRLHLIKYNNNTLLFLITEYELGMTKWAKDIPHQKKVHL